MSYPHLIFRFIALRYITRRKNTYHLLLLLKVINQTCISSSKVFLKQVILGFQRDCHLMLIKLVFTQYYHFIFKFLLVIYWHFHVINNNEVSFLKRM